MTTHSDPLEVRQLLVLLAMFYLVYIGHYAKMFIFVNLDNAISPEVF